MLHRHSESGTGAKSARCLHHCRHSTNCSSLQQSTKPHICCGLFISSRFGLFVFITRLYSKSRSQTIRSPKSPWPFPHPIPSPIMPQFGKTWIFFVTLAVPQYLRATGSSPSQWIWDFGGLDTEVNLADNYFNSPEVNILFSHHIGTFFCVSVSFNA